MYSASTLILGGERSRLQVGLGELEGNVEHDEASSPTRKQLEELLDERSLVVHRLHRVHIDLRMEVHLL